MSMDDLIAKFRAEQKTACRICGGNAPHGLYCPRHFFMLRGNDRHLMEAAKDGERLDEVDVYILLHARFGKSAVWIPGYGLRIGAFTTLRQSGTEWVLRRTMKGVPEQKLGRYASIKDACAAVLAARSDLSVHNRYARKTLIR